MHDFLDFCDFEDLFEKYWFDTNLTRITKELELISENRIIERTDYVFSIPQTEDNEYLLLFLDPRQRKLQVNQNIRNGEGKNIDILTADETVKIFRNVFNIHLEERTFDYEKIFGYSPRQESINELMEYLLHLNEQIEEHDETSRILTQLLDVTHTYKIGGYQPLILIKKPYTSHVSICEEVYRLGEFPLTIRMALSFIFLRDLEFYWVLDFSYASMHYKFKPPKGLTIKDVNFGFADEDMTTHYNEPKEDPREDYFDENTLHVHIPKKYFLSNQDNLNVININFGIGKNSPIYPLIFLFWFFILVPVIFCIDLLDIFEYWVLPATIIIALSIYSMERPFLKHYLFTHLCLGFSIGFIIYLAKISWIISP